MENNVNPSLNVYNIDQLLNMDLPPREFIVYPILKTQGIIMIYAKRGIGKTYVALTLSYCIAKAKNMFNDKWKVEKPYRVLYIDGEMAASTIKERLENLINNFEGVLNPDNLKIITPDLQNECIMPNLATIEGQKLLESYIQESDVIILDNLSTLCRNGRENDADSWLPVQGWILRLRALGKSIIIIHHAGKNEQQRGTSKKEDVLDTVIALKRPEKYHSSEGARFEVHYEKSRDFHGEPANPFEVVLNVNNDTKQANWVINEIEDVNMQKILDLRNLNYSQRKISKELSKNNEVGVSLSSVNRTLKKAKEIGLI